ncbi:alpha-ketoglutarate-dependent dioxygenase AlkB [Pseudoxanthomonas japonensis]|uniref:Alpha-ketoglutarate-dependent dioxygenase AlkB n=2 Tax=Pseudoxanthomonas japonensis TaxID=69284 RepID=A0ABQ6ZME0_9GAMM|nr:alpha-ketoglutarate-dependent dioxygenase AlkB [Pseudoxanthomonas japonensis]
MRDAEVFLLRDFPLPLPASEALTRLIEETTWRSEEVTVWGKRHVQPRLIAWYGDPGRSYSYSGISVAPLPWTPLIEMLRQSVQNQCDETFNSVLLNYYRNERDSMGMHSDDEPELGTRPIIASLSLGETRTFVFKHKTQDVPLVRVPLHSGTLLLMKGSTQRFWKHGIAKASKTHGPRVNLTFRQVRHGLFDTPK